MAGEKVLVIDSSPDDVARLVGGVLQPGGYLVAKAMNGAEGLRQALSWRPDLIIADYGTQQRSGLDLVAQLRHAGREIPLIYTGAVDSADILRWAIRAGAVDFVLKPLDVEEMRAAVGRALLKSRTALAAETARLPGEDQKRANSELAQRVRELNVLHGLGKAVTSTRDLEKLLNRIVEAAIFLTKAEEGYILLVDEGSQELYLRAGQGLGQKLASGFRVKSSDSVVWRVVETGQPAVINADLKDEKIKIKTGFLVRSLLHAPLKLRGKVIGVISVDNKVARRRFGENDKHLLLALADYAAIAIDNARQIEAVQAETSRLASMLSEQEAALPGQAAAELDTGRLASAAVLSQELRSLAESAGHGLKEAETLARQLGDQTAAVERLAEMWSSHRLGAEALAQRLSSARLIAVDHTGGTLADALVGLQGVFTQLGAGFLIADARGAITAANQYAAGFLGVDSLLGRGLDQLAPLAAWSGGLVETGADVESAPPAWQEFAFMSDGRLIKAVVMAVAAGAEKGWAVVLRDLLREHGTRYFMRDVSAALGQELRTPMTVVSSYVELLLAESVGLLVPAQRRLLEQMRGSLVKMGRDAEPAVGPAGRASRGGRSTAVGGRSGFSHRSSARGGTNVARGQRDRGAGECAHGPAEGGGRARLRPPDDSGFPPQRDAGNAPRRGHRDTGRTANRRRVARTGTAPGDFGARSGRRHPIPISGPSI